MGVAERERRGQAECDRSITARLRTTRSSRILQADASAARLLRRDLAMLVDKPLVVFVPIDERPTFRARLALLPTGGGIEDWPLDFATPDGTIVPVRVAVHAREDVSNGRGDELHWTLTAPLPTDDEGEVVPPGSRRADAGDVARECAELRHELKQPLSAIISYARGAMMRARNRSLTPADLEGVLEIIVTEAMRVAERLRRREDEQEVSDDIEGTRRRR
jgi:hypothetical protein